MPKGGLSEEEKLFIVDQYKDKKQTGQQIIKAFQEKFDWIPAASTISKYQNYEAGSESQDEPKGDDIEIITKDTRKDKTNIIDISDGEIDEEDLEKIVKIRGTNANETWRFLKLCGRKGYTKINLETGDIEK